MQRNKGPMYCFAEAGWEIFFLSFAAQVISLAFSGPFFGPFDGGGIPLPVQKKPLPFTNCLDGEVLMARGTRLENE